MRAQYGYELVAKLLLLPISEGIQMVISKSDSPKNNNEKCARKRITKEASTPKIAPEAFMVEIGDLLFG